MMKKLKTLGISIAMSCLCTCPAFAAEVTDLNVSGYDTLLETAKQILHMI